MDFQFTEEQQQLRRSVREFAEREIAPNVMKWDEGSHYPAEYGGAGMGYVEYVSAIEELSRVDGSIGITVAAHISLGTNHIWIAGNEAQKKKYVT